MADGFGKKTGQASKGFIELPEIHIDTDLSVSKHVCRLGVVHTLCKQDPVPFPEVLGELVKLETFTGPVYEENGKRYYNLYWRVMCIECGEEFKQVNSTYEVDEVGLEGPNTLRWE